ncbi:MAG TPA: ABC transporter substrate-binding protein [Gaiellaceae bacterium]|nr:ABC transporter substrate-binding protein [Gaiellaceae bacterium]
MKKKYWWVVAVGSLCLLVGAAAADAAQKSASKGKPIIVGYSIAKTGGFATYDTELEDGGKIAAAAINAKGGVLGRQIKIIDCDTQTQLSKSGPCAQQLIAKGAQVIIGTSDYDYGGGADRAGAAKHLLVLGFAGDPRLGYHGIGPTAFNLYQGSNAEGAVAAEFAFSKGWRKAYMLTDTINSYPSTVSNSFEIRWKQLTGHDVIGKDVFNNADASISTQVSRIRTAKPDVILVASFPPGGASAIKQIRAAGINTPIVTDEAFDGSAWISAIPNVSNVFVPNLASGDGNDPSPAVNRFFVQFKKFTGSKAVLAAYPVMGYSQIQVMAKGMEMAKSTSGPKVAAALEKLHNFPALIGPTSYDWRKNCNVAADRPFVIFQITNGKEHFVKSLVPKVVPPFKC